MRKLAAALAALSLSLPIKSFALGVGDIEWQSSLNQPLSAEIKLLSYESLGLNDIVVTLAPYEAYQKSGVDYAPVLRNLKFAVEERESGELYIKVTSNKSIRDPFLDILIDIDWPSGHLLREYTLLLDLPVFVDEEPAAIAAPTAAAVPESMSEAMGAEDDMPASPPTESSDSIFISSMKGSSSNITSGPQGELRYGVVKRGDTLWEIAARMRSDDSVSVQQVMMTLLKDNPEAFYNNNVNSLKAGYVLRINDPDSIASISKTEAARDAHRQYNRWLDAKKSKGELPTRSSRMSDELATNSVEGSSGARLKLVAPDASEMNAAMTGQSSAGSDSAATGEALSSAMLSAEASGKENAELRERIARLEAQIGEMQRLLTLRDDTLTVLQNQEDVTAVIDEPAKQEVAPVAAVKQEPAVAAKPKPKAVKAAPVEKNLIDTLLEDPKMMGIFGGVILLLLLLVKKLLGRRKDGSDEEQVGEEASAISEQDVVGNESSDALVDDGLSSGLASADAGMPTIQAEVDEIDVLAEADVYLAYQRFDRAEELLNDAISNDPGHYELVVKLLDVYVASENQEAFIRTAEKLHEDVAESDPSLWARVLPMGAKFVADHALFSSYTPGQGEMESVEAVIPGAELEAELDQLDGEQGLDVSDLEGLDFDLGDLGDLGDLDDLDGLDKSEEKNDSPQGDTEVAGDAGLTESDGLAMDYDADSEVGQDGSVQDDGAMDFDLESPLEDADLNDDADQGEGDSHNESTVEAVMTANNELAGESVDELAGSLDFESEVSSEASLEENASSENEEELKEDTLAGDNSLDFDAAELTSTGSVDVDTIEDNLEPATTEESDAGLDDGLSLDTDEQSIEFDASPDGNVDVVGENSSSDDASEPEGDGLSDEGLDFASAVDTDTGTDTASTPTLDVDEPSTSGDDQVASIDQDLEDDIDWLASVADDEVLFDDDADAESNGLFSGDDEVATKLDLVRAYIDMGDKESARDILNEVMAEGDAGQKIEASELLERING